jgi:hypothetical protein
MKNILIYASIVCITVFSVAFTNNSKNEEKKRLENLSGTYADQQPYAYGTAWGKRVFTFNKGSWTLDFTLALDKELKMPVFQFRTYGNYIVQEKSTSVANTYNAVFYEEKKFLTLKTADENLINAFGFAACQMKKDVEMDVSEKGCSGWKSVAECPADHDLLSLDKDGKLYFGNRPQDNNMCSADKRPTSLTPPVVKIK